MRIAAIVASLALSIVALADASSVQAMARQETNIPAQPLDGALRALAKERGFHIVYLSGTVNSVRTQGANGSLTRDEALAQLLNGTGLVFRYLDEETVTIVPVSGATALNDAITPGTSGVEEDPGKRGQGVSFWDRFRLAQMDQGKAASDRSVETDKIDSPRELPKLEEVVVSAEKRDERLQDVPVPVTAVSTDTLVTNNLLRLQDYQALMPGLSVALNDFGAPELAIRGLTTGTYSNPTVGMVIDDVPFGASSALVYGDQAPDLDPSDLVRVEELRGPQGTLYGASSLGGLLKYVTVDPSTQSFSGRLEAGFSSVHNGNQLGCEFRGALNAPITDTLALRASAFTRIDPGYIDDPTRNAKGVNRGEHSGVRLSGLWHPSDALSLKLSAMFQKSHVDGSSLVDVGPTLKDLQQSDVANTGWFDRHLQFYSAVATAKLGAGELTSISGYSINHWSDSLDYTSAFGSYSEALFGVPGTILNNSPIETDKFSEELRFSIPLGTRLDWMLGGFYTNERSSVDQIQFAADFATGIPMGVWVTAHSPFTYKEYAAFTNFTLHLSDRFDIQLGGRESRNEQRTTPTDVGPYNEMFLLVPSPYTYPEQRADGSAFTYLVTPRLRVSKDFMVYARVASGYRPGGPNIILPAGSSIPASYKPDKTRNYEVGIKSDILDHKLSFDASVYYIDWKEIQLSFTTANGYYYTANGSAAKSQGVELSVTARPVSGFKVVASVDLDDAQLTQALPLASTTMGAAGDRLPFTPRFFGSLSLEDEFPLAAHLTGFAGGALTYVGRRLGVFEYGGSDRQTYPSYTPVNLRSGVTYDTWTANLFINNAFDKRGVLDGGLGTINPAAFHFLQPRTVGFSLVKSF